MLNRNYSNQTLMKSDERSRCYLLMFSNFFVLPLLHRELGELTRLYAAYNAVVKQWNTVFFCNSIIWKVNTITFNSA